MPLQLSLWAELGRGKVVVVHVEGYAAVIVAEILVRILRQRDHALYLDGVAAVLERPAD